MQHTAPQPTHTGRDPLDLEAREAMTPGVVCIDEEAPLTSVGAAFAVHGIRSLLVLSHADARPLGWVTSGGMLPWADQDTAFVVARDAIGEPVRTITPTATLRDALPILRDGAEHLLVQRADSTAAEGVLSRTDIGRLGL